MIVWIKIVGTVIVVSLIWWWNRRKRQQNELDNTLHCDSGVQDLYSLEEEFPRLRNFMGNLTLGLGQYRFYKISEGKTLVGIILFNWPSSLWMFRKSREETLTLGSYSHIHYVEILEEYRNKGYLSNLLDHVFSETHRISSGITIDVVDPSLKDILVKKFEFRDCGTYLKLSYDNWS